MSTHTWATETADEIRGLMAKKHKKQVELAQVLGIAQAGVSRRLSGKTPFDINELGRIAEWLDVPITRLFGEPGGTIATNTDRSLLDSFSVPVAA